MGYFQVRYDFRVINYDRRGFIRLATVRLYELAEKGIKEGQIDTLDIENSLRRFMN